MNLLEIQEYIEEGESLDIKDIEQLLKEERLSTINSIIDFIEHIKKTLAKEEDQKMINKLLLNIKDEFKEV